MKKRCAWAEGNELQAAYHDTEWGVPVHDDRRFFEFLILEGAQAGLSWDTILRKREAYRKAFARFDPRAVARFGKKEVAALMKNPGIVRNRLKIESAVTNAKAFLAVQTGVRQLRRATSGASWTTTRSKTAGARGSTSPPPRPSPTR